MPVFGVSHLWSPDTGSFIRKIPTASIGALEIGFDSRIPRTLPDDIVRLAADHSIRLSIHLPFFMSWGDAPRVAQSIRILQDGASLASTLDSISVFHLGYYLNQPFENLRNVIAKGIESAIESTRSRDASKPFLLGVETSGKITEIGSIEEVITIVGEFSRSDVIPVVDWSHLYARTNGQFPRNEEDYRRVLHRLESELRMKHFYFHASGIEFRNGQEKRHVSVKTCSPPLPHLFKVLNEEGYDYTLIVESPDPVQDVLWLDEVKSDPENWLKFAERKLAETGLQQTLL